MSKMKDFLAYVAEDILCRYGTNLSHIAIVFPNKRASLFLNEHLVFQAGHPLWSPAYITISDLFRSHSPLTVADPIKLVCELHKSFCLCTGSTETLDKFYGWGQLLLSDFDDIDKNMADADRVFANLRDIHELDDISYLTVEQREMIRRFFSNFSEEHNSELKERFLRLWSHFADIYHDFNERLSVQRLCYEGALYRQVAEDSSADFEHDRYLFVGFNLLQKVEQRLFKRLQKEGKAHFYWDFDHYYMPHPKTNDSPIGSCHEAGQYISQYLHCFPNELSNDDNDIYCNFTRPKHISYIATPTENIQARYISTWLREHQRYADGRRTAIVLCNEELLPTVIHCLPPEVEKVNVTTGYPLSQTPVASFIQLYFNSRTTGISLRLQRAFQRHPYYKWLDKGSEQSGLREMLHQIATKAKDEVRDPLFQESLFRAYTLINRLDDLIQNGDLQVDNITLQRLVGQLMQQTTIPFHGEPAEGLQVMGVLETRNLDFDHVLLLSCNEGNMPRGVNDSSFIPHSIRHAYELTTIDNKVAIYSYYFHRLLQRAQDVTILYNNSTEDGQRGEMSRFMLQLMVESGHDISHHILRSGQTAPRWQPQPIDKTNHVIQVLGSSSSPLVSSASSPALVLSPTAINRYIHCPLQFYYRYVADIREPDLTDDEQELDNRVFGNIFHEAADIIYKQLPQYIDRQLLEHLLHTKVEIERAVDEAFHKVMPTAPIGGLMLINREVIIHYLRQLLTIDSRLAPFTIIGLECDVYRTLPPIVSSSLPLKIGGRIDRLDLINEGTPDECIRVIDYKTGGRKLKPLNSVDDIFASENTLGHSGYYLQTFIYADIVRHSLPPHLQKALKPNPQRPVSPALLFIQHAGGDNYDPTLCFGHEPICDIADHSAHFNELLEAKITEIFSPDTPFIPTADLRVCHTCPYAQLCWR